MSNRIYFLSKCTQDNIPFRIVHPAIWSPKHLFFNCFSPGGKKKSRCHWPHVHNNAINLFLHRFIFFRNDVHSNLQQSRGNTLNQSFPLKISIFLSHQGVSDKISFSKTAFARATQNLPESLFKNASFNKCQEEPTNTEFPYLQQTDRSLVCRNLLPGSTLHHPPCLAPASGEQQDLESLV